MTDRAEGRTGPAAHLYGLAAALRADVRNAIGILASERRMVMALCGAASLACLDRDLLISHQIEEAEREAGIKRQL